MNPAKAVEISILILEHISAKYVERYKQEGVIVSCNGLVEELELFNDIIKNGIIKDRAEN